MLPSFKSEVCVRKWEMDRNGSSIDIEQLGIHDLHATLQALQETISRGEEERCALYESVRKLALRNAPTSSLQQRRIAGAHRHHIDPEPSAARGSTFLRKHTNQQAWRYHYKTDDDLMNANSSDGYIHRLEMDNRQLRLEIDALQKEGVKRDADYTHTMHVLQNKASTAEVSLRQANDKILQLENELAGVKRQHHDAAQALERTKNKLSSLTRESSFKRAGSSGALLLHGGARLAL